jgi:hypothetical protein
MSQREPERVVDSDPIVLQGEDEVPREPPPPLDPYTPGPRSGSAASGAMWVAVAVIALLAITILVAAMR